MSNPITEGWDGHHLYVRIYGREPDAEGLKRMKALWRECRQEEDREELWQRRERLEQHIIPDLSSEIRGIEDRIRQAAKGARSLLLKPRPKEEGFAVAPWSNPTPPPEQIAKALGEVGRTPADWTGDRLKGRPEEAMLAELDEAREKHKKRVEELSVLRAFLNRPPEPQAEQKKDTELDEDQSTLRCDDYAEWVGHHIDQAKSLSHAYALALASDPKGFDPDKAEQYRKQEYKSDREVVRQAWRRSGYLDTGPYTPQKLKHLKRRVKRYADEGIPPERPED